MFLRRIGPDPHQNGPTPNSPGCPDIWELADGDFLMIGRDETDTFREKLPPTASCGAEERLIRIPRSILVNARKDIPLK